jgi:hypothetical protein
MTTTRAFLRFAAWCAANGRPMFEEGKTMKQRDTDGGLADASHPDFVEQLVPVDGAEDELDLELDDASAPGYQEKLR